MIKHFSGNITDVYFDVDNHFIEWFDKITGKYIRTGVYENGKDTGIDPFKRSMANLLDVGIMGSCQHGKSGLCIKAGVECYQNGLGVSMPDMSYKDYQNIIEQVKGKVMQIALGGRGDPNKHKFFGDILKLTYGNGIIPNYTTSGLGLTDGEIEATKRFCGAVAVSWYRSDYTLNAIERFVKAGVTTNIHYVLSNSSIQEAIERLRGDTFTFPSGVNAVIFLIHKPVGLGSQREVLKADNPLVKEFFKLVDSWDGSFKIGFESCSIPGILNFTSSIDLESLDTCEGARFSAYITSDMIMTPCSFDNQKLKYGVSLRDYSIQDAWDSEPFNQFRNKLSGSCPDCPIRSSCMGGCPLTPEIVLCDKECRSEN
jgi:radical SAM protein with 4Fe4S-binding SPASM domain